MGKARKLLIGYKDSAPKITAYQGLKMATNVIKPRNNGSITPKKLSSNKVQASTYVSNSLIKLSNLHKTYCNIYFLDVYYLE